MHANMYVRMRVYFGTNEHMLVIVRRLVCLLVAAVEYR